MNIIRRILDRLAFGPSQDENMSKQRCSPAAIAHGFDGHGYEFVECWDCGTHEPVDSAGWREAMARLHGVPVPPDPPPPPPPQPTTIW